VSDEPAKPITIRILDKEYRIGCPEGEEDQLQAAARLLDERMKDIRRGGKVIGSERIAVMTALNLAHELLSKQQDQGEQADAAVRRVRTLRERVEAALNDTNQLEL
jgi:cell division protein ZapA